MEDQWTLEESASYPDKSAFIREMQAGMMDAVIHLLRFLRTLPQNQETAVFSRQLIRSASSAAANYRAACRSRSDKEFIAKISITVEELDETLFWLELLQRAQWMDKETYQEMEKNWSRYVAIMSRSRNTMMQRQQQNKKST